MAPGPSRHAPRSRGWHWNRPGPGALTAPRRMPRWAAGFCRPAR